MKKMLKILVCILIMNLAAVSAEAKQTLGVYKHDLAGKNSNPVMLSVDNLTSENDIVLKNDKTKPPEKIENYKLEDYILKEAKADEYVVIMDFKVDNDENPYPEIRSMDVKAEITEQIGGGDLLGKDYRLIYFDGEKAEDVSANITESDKKSVNFKVDKLGKYVIYYNPRVYEIKFYGKPLYTTEDEDVVYELHHQSEGIGKYDTIIFPKIPTREGYVFTGWQKCLSSGDLEFADPQPNNTTSTKYDSYYASWCPKDEYEPIKIEISSEEKIIKGKENGKKITLATNYGVFSEYNDLFQSDWRDAYEAETDEENKEYLLSEWNSKWKVVGSDDIMIESVNIINDKTLELELSGNSGDQYTDSEIAIEFDGFLLNPEGYDSDNDVSDTKIKLDEDGVRAKMYRSDNTIKLSRQQKSSSGGSLAKPNTINTEKLYTVAFDTNGGSEIPTQTLKADSNAQKPENPQKDGCVFAGWYLDKDFVSEFNFSEKVNKNISLYAKWEAAENKDDATNKIVFTVGQNEAVVFGELKQNDVSPIIKGDRAFLPARFIAENMGAKVDWDAENQIVTITKDSIKIVITIGAETATVNEEEEKLDYPAFIENGRTYTPIRFVAENLGGKVEWDSENQNITIIK